jgi:hypothetical protein
MDGITPIVRPAPFAVLPRWSWEHCDVPGYEAFAVYVVRNLTNRDREELNEAHDGIVRAQVEWFALTPEERASRPTPRRMEQELIAPYVKDWNATGLDEDGKERPLPPPAEAGPDVFEAIYPEMYDWIVRHVLLGYRTGKGVGSWQTPSGSTSGPRIVESGE